MLKNSNNSLSIKSILLVINIFLLFCWAIFFSLDQTLYIPTNHIDGTYQTASALYRLDAGQVIGKDFFPYLGIGPILILYPVFKLMGGNIAASLFSTQLVILVLSVIATAFIWELIWKSKNILTATAAGCYLFLLPLAITSYFSLELLPNWLLFNITPGPSIRPIRAWIPYLPGIFLYLSVHFKVTTKILFFLIIVPIILLWSNDFALPTTVLLFLFVFILNLHTKELTSSKMVLLMLTSILIWFLLLTTTTMGSPFLILKYNFLDVARDQWWYFGPYNEDSRIFSIQDINKLFNIIDWKALLIILSLAIFSLKVKSIEMLILFWLGLALLMGGLLATIGGHINHSYFGGFYFFTYMLTVITVLYWATKIIKRFFGQKNPETALLFTSIALFLLVTKISNHLYQLKELKSDPNHIFINELGGYINTQYKEYIELIRSSKGKIVFEEYWGIWSATLRITPLPKVDSLIHALGEVRDKSVSLIANAEIIITTRPTSSWVEWSLSQNYWFYGSLLKEWSPTFIAPETLVWIKDLPNRQASSIPCSILENNRLSIQTEKYNFLEIEIEIEIEKFAFRNLILVRNNFFNSPFSAGGYASINPSQNRIIFPAQALDDENIYDFKTIPPNTSNIQLLTCRVQILEIPSLIKDLLQPARSSHDLTDHNWVKGIHRTESVFFISNTAINKINWLVGNSIKLANGDIRRINAIIEQGAYLHIHFDGPPLNGAIVGYPHKIKIIKEKTSSTSFDLTDTNWIKGVHRTESMFFIPNSAINKKDWLVGDTIKLANGDMRKITAVIEQGAYLHIYFDGLPLDGALVGYPHQIEIIKEKK